MIDALDGKKKTYIALNRFQITLAEKNDD